MKSIGCSQSVTVGRQGVRVDFPESEFFIHATDDPASAQCRVTFTAVVRAAPPSLSTWWCDWTRTCPKTRAAEMALEEIVAARSRFRRLISDAAPVRGVPPSGPPVDCGPVYVIGTPKGRTTRGWHPRTANSTFGVQH